MSCIQRVQVWLMHRRCHRISVALLGVQLKDRVQGGFEIESTEKSRSWVMLALIQLLKSQIGAKAGDLTHLLRTSIRSRMRALVSSFCWASSLEFIMLSSRFRLGVGFAGGLTTPFNEAMVWSGGASSMGVRDIYYVCRGARCSWGRGDFRE